MSKRNAKRETVYIQSGKIPERACPSRGAVHDQFTGATTPRPRDPEPGDVVMCSECGAINVYYGGLKLLTMYPEARRIYFERNSLAKAVLDAWNDPTRARPR